nr:MFS transporter [Gammaproteobacteria bacterium]
DFELSKDNFSTIRLPNEENFYMDDRHEETDYVMTSEPCMSNCIDGEAKVVQRARILDVTPDSE